MIKWRITAPAGRFNLPDLLRGVARRVRARRSARVLVRVAAIAFHVVSRRVQLRSLRRNGTRQTWGAQPARTPRAVAVLHVYYPSLLDELIDAAERAPWVSRVLITCAFEQQSAIQRSLASRETKGEALPIRVVSFENFGSDVLPFLKVLDDEWLLDADLLLKIHTKRSPHLPIGKGDTWRRSLLEGLAPTDELRRLGASELLKRTAEDQYPRLIWPIRWAYSVESWGANRSATLQLWRGQLSNSRGPLVFPAGTMFWCNKPFLEVLRHTSRATSSEIHSSETYAPDGAIAHAVERRIGQLASSLRAAVLTW